MSVRPDLKRLRPLIVLAVVVLVGGGLWLWLRARGPGPERFTGYVVSDNLYLSSPVAGTVTQVSVARGQRVTAGDPLFRVDPTILGAKAEQAQAQIQEAEAQALAQQADEARARSAVAGAEAERRRAEADLARLLQAEGEKAGSVAPQQIDQARAAAVNARTQLQAARAQAEGAARRTAAARAQAASSRAGLQAARREVDELAPAAPVAARVETVMYQPGEWAAANAPVVSLVPDNQVKVRFYLPQGLMSAYPPGTRVGIACDGCAAGMTARVDFVATRPEYTPPVIYSLQTRDKLVFMVEAVPSDPRALVPGQPIDVTPLREARR